MLTFHFFLSLAPCSQIDKARADHICPRGLVFINPGNPTGQQLTEDELRGMIKVGGGSGESGGDFCLGGGEVCTTVFWSEDRLGDELSFEE
jgi:hypothetical protein